MQDHRALVVVSCALLAGCDAPSTGKPGRLADPSTALAEANGLARRHRVAEALQVIESSGLGAAPPVTDALYELRSRQAQLLLNVSRPREACRTLDELARARPQDASARRSLAQALLESGESAKAVEAFESLPGPQLAEALVDYGTALLDAGRAADAAAAHAACLIRDPWSDPAQLGMGRALVRLDQSEAGAMFLARHQEGEWARKAEQEALAFEVDGDEARGLLRRAKIELDRGRLFDAMELENRALQLNRGLGEAYLDLARLSLFLARPGDAIQVLEQLPEEPAVLEVLREAREAAASVQGPRASARDSMKGKGLTSCPRELLALAEELERSGAREDARRLSIFVARLALQETAVAATVARLFDAKPEVFIRLWAARGRIARGDFGQRLASELQPLGIDPGRVMPRL